MALVPGEGSQTPNIASGVGSGIDIVTSSGGVDNLSAFLVAGGGISITPSLVNKSITIAGLPGPVGVSVVQSGLGSGIETVESPPGTVTLTGKYVAGTGLAMVPSGINESVTINNTQTVSAQNGSGIKLTQVGTNTDFAVQLVNGGGIGVTPNPGNVGITLTNQGVTRLTAGSGISLSAQTGNITVATTGVTGVTSVSAGTGIGITGTSSAPIVNTLLNGTPFRTGINLTTSVLDYPNTPTNKISAVLAPQSVSQTAVAPNAGGATPDVTTIGGYNIYTNGFGTMSIKANPQTGGSGASDLNICLVYSDNPFDYYKPIVGSTLTVLNNNNIGNNNMWVYIYYIGTGGIATYIARTQISPQSSVAISTTGHNPDDGAPIGGCPYSFIFRTINPPQSGRFN